MQTIEKLERASLRACKLMLGILAVTCIALAVAVLTQWLG
jgi:hypothetical protein